MVSGMLTVYGKNINFGLKSIKDKKRIEKLLHKMLAL